jgi:phage shock protein PspC (stress-responsive transcriptional regulator)
MPKQTTPPTDSSEADSAGSGDAGTTPPPPADGKPAEHASEQTAPAQPAAPTPSGNRFFLWLRSLGLVREPGWIGGVAVGIADRLGIDVIIVRGILVVVAVFGGPALLLYAAAWLLLPDARGKIHLEEMLRGRFEPPLVGIAVLVAISVLPVAPSFWSLGATFWGQPFWGASFGRAIWTLVVIALLIGFVVWFSRRARPTPPAAPVPPATPADPASETADAAAATATLPTTADGTEPDPNVTDWRDRQTKWKTEHDAYLAQRSEEKRVASQQATAAAKADRMARAALEREERARTRSNPLYSVSVIGLAFIGGAITALALGAGVPGPIDFLAGAGVAVGILGLGIVLNGAMGRRSGGASAIAVLLLIPLIVSAIFPQTAALKYAGNRDVVLHSVGQGTTRTYTQLSGNITIDLSDYWRTPRPTKAADYSAEEVRVIGLSGNIKVIVPADEYEYLSATALSGSITTLNGTRLPHNGSPVSYSRTTSPVSGDVNQTHAARMLDVEAFAGSGNITFVKGAN